MPTLLGVGHVPDYEGSVRTTLELTFERLAQSSVATAVLEVVACCAPVKLPRVLLDAIASRLSANDLSMNQAISELLRFSLVNSEHDGLSCHALVGIVMRLRGADSTKPVLTAAAALEDVFPELPNDPSLWERSGEILPHILHVAEQAEQLELREDAASLLHRAGNYLTATSDLREARRVFEREAPLIGELHGRNSITYAMLLNDYGIVLRDLGEFRAAQGHLSESLRIKEELLGDNILLSSSLMNLATAERELGNLGNARDLHLRSLAVISRHIGEDNSEYAMELSNLGTVELDDGRPGEARDLFDRALAVLERSAGANPLTFATVRGNLGNALLDVVTTHV